MRPNLTRAFVAGFAATIAITLMMYFVTPMMSGGPMDIAALLGGLLGGSWVAGIVAHFVIGSVIFPLVYCFLAFRVLTGSAAVRGMTWGLILWFVSQAAVMPALGGGFFSSQSGGLTAVMDSLVGHLVYGFVFGVGTGGAHARQPAEPALGSEVHVRRAG